MEKIAVIFGASSGIGYSVSQQLVNKGYKVFNCSRHVSPDKRINNYLCDTSKSQDIEEVFGDIGQIERRIDALVYCSGTSMAAPFEHTKEEDYRYLFEVNYFGMVKAVQLALPLLKEAKGMIVLISSLAAVLPIPYDVFYSCSKSAMNVFAMGLTSELDQVGIKIVSVMPGGTRTDFTNKRTIYGKDECGAYKSAVDTSANELAEMEQEGMCPDKVAEVICEALESENPPICIAAGVKNKFFNQGVKLMPKRLTIEAIKARFKV